MKRKPNIHLAAIVETAVIFALAMLICLAIDVLTSCATARDRIIHTDTALAVSTDTLRDIRRDTIRDIRIRLDSVTVRDSVFTLIKGDTVLIREYHFRDRTKNDASDTYSARADTVWRERTRTIYRTRTETGQIGLTKWQRFRLGAFWWLTAAVAIAACIIIRKRRINH